MEVDISNKQISELLFGDPAGSGSTDAVAAEREAGRSVALMNASRNQITCIVGLGAVFTQLTQLDLSHNDLGVSSTPPYVARQHAQHIARMVERQGWPAQEYRVCGGVPDWIAALPPTLQVLNLSHNHLSSLAACTCGHSPTEGRAAVPAEPAALRYLRHACPLAVSLMFPAEQLPELRRLDLSHNALAVSGGESDAMEEAWLSLHESLGDELALPACRATDVDLSGNPGLASANCVLLCAPSPAGPESLCLAKSGIDDLAGLSGAAAYAPALRELRLHPTPISTALLTSPAKVLAAFLESIVLPRLTEDPEGGPNSHRGMAEGSFEQIAVTRALGDLTSQRFGELNTALTAMMTEAGVGFAMSLTPGAAWDEHGLDLAAVATCVYASLLLEVIPTLRLIDGHLDARWCRDACMAAVQAALVAQSTQQRAPGRPPNLTDLAAIVAPQLRPRVLIEEAPAATGTQGVEPPHFQQVLDALQPPAPTAPAAEWFTPAALPLHGEARGRYEELCVEAGRLEAELLRAGGRTDALGVTNSELRKQLADDRRLIADQRKETSRLRTKRDTLQAQTLVQQTKLKRRQKEIAYGVDAMRSRLSTAREKDRLRELEAREQALESREKDWKRRMGQLEALSVSYHHNLHQPSGGPPPRQRPVRSVVLREAAARKKMEEMGCKDPLAYSPTRFSPRSSSRSPPTDSPEDGAIPAHRGDSPPHGVRSPPPAANRERCVSSSPYGSESINGSDTRNSALRSMLAEDEAAYFDSYNADAALVSSRRNSPFGGDSRPAASALKPPPPFPSSSSREASGDPEAKGSVPPGAVTAADTATGSTLDPSPVRDLSALSLTELFEAAAAIRRRQVALQQLQDQWQEQRKTATSPMSTKRHQVSPLPDISPATPVQSADADTKPNPPEIHRALFS